MKLLFVTAIKEDLPAISQMMQIAEIPVFSVSETVGHKTIQKDYMPDNWFGKTGDGTDAILLFSFTEAIKAEKILQYVNSYNEKTKTNFPIRAFITPVEQSTN
jgi:hypothetical protein